MNADRVRRLAGWGALLIGLSAFAFWGLQQGLPSELSLALGEHTWDFSDQRALLLLAVIPLLILGSVYSLSGLPWQQRAISFLLRAGMFVALALGLARPTEEHEESKICSVALVDVSQSVSDEALVNFSARLSQLYDEKREQDELRLVAFAEQVREVELETNETGALAPLSPQALRGDDKGGVTDVEGALRLASAWTRSDCLAHYVLFTDGIETRGDVFSVLGSQNDARKARLYTSLLSQRPEGDVAVVGVDIPQGVRVGEPFFVRVLLSSTAGDAGQLRLYQGNTLNGLEGVRTIEVPAGESSQSIQSVVRVPGDITYRAQFIPDGSDRFLQNNAFQVSLEVPGPPRVLLVDRRVDQATYLAQALAAQQLDVDVRAPSALPRSAAEWASFDFVILSDVAYGDVSRGSEALLMDYVRSGGGLLFAGGEAGFGPGGWDRSALKRILPVTMDSRKEREIPGVAMVLVIDRSGSMTGLPLSMAKEACNATVGALEGNDLIEVVAFDSRPTRYVKMQPARYRTRIASSVARIQPGGGTEIFNSLDMAYQDLSVVEARKKHIILLTDGNANSDGIYELSATAFSEGITITSVGLGTGVNQSLLQMIAETGGGRFHAAEDPTKLPRIFTRETEIISKKATLDDWFPVSAVSGADFLEGVGIASAPLLRGYTSTQLGPPPSSAILVSDRGEPILARKPVGLGWTLAWTSDLKTRWAIDWLKWSGFGRLMAQIVREHQEKDDTQLRPMSVELIGEELVARVEAYDSRENFDNSLHSTLFVRLVSGEGQSPDASSAQADGSNDVGSESKGFREAVPFSRVAPGLYEARTELRHFGSYALTARHQRAHGDEMEPAGVSYGSVSLPYPEEFRDLTPRNEKLSDWANAGGGVRDPGVKEVWSPNGDSVVTRKERQNDFIWLAIVLFFADLLMRRVRLFDFGFRAGRAPS